MKNSQENSLNSEKSSKLLCAILITYLAIIMRDLFNFNIGFSMYSLLCTLFYIFLKPWERIAFTTFLLPFRGGLPFSEILLYFTLINIFSERTDTRTSAQIVAYLLIGLIISIEFFDSLYKSSPNMRIVYLAVYMIYVTNVAAAQKYKSHEKNILIYFSLGVLLAAGTVFIHTVNTYGINYLFTYKFRFGNMGSNLALLTSSTSFDSNEMGMYCLIAFCCLLVIYQAKIKAPKVLWLLVVGLVFLGFLSISRTYLILLVVAVCYYFVNPHNIKKTISLIIISVLVFVCFYLLFPKFFDWLYNIFADRISLVKGDDFGGRVYIFEYYNKIIMMNIWNFIFGSGMDYNIIYGFSAHNGIQEIFVCWGLFGFLLCTIWIYNIVKATLKNSSSKNRLTAFLPFFIFILYTQTIQLFTQYSYLILLLITGIAARLNDTLDKSERE